MSMSHHAYRPIFIRTSRPWWKRLRGAVLAVLVLATVTSGTSWLIARLYATEAQLQAAHAQGMALGMRTCPGR